MFPFEINASIAVAVSGGPDSMALLHLLRAQTKNILAITIEHGLREESAAEAKAVAAWCKQHKIEHHLLRWRGAKPKTGLHEAARAARYELLEKFCRQHKVLHLATAHHANDQAETILQRIAKASGPAGLSGIAEHSYLPHLHLWRPLLSHPKADLVKYCEIFNIPFARDASNENQKYARGRLRSASDVLAAEGLTAANLGLLAAKQREVSHALEMQTAEFLASHAGLFPTERAEINAAVFHALPQVIQQMAMDHALKLTSGNPSPIRYDSIARLCAALVLPNFRAKTLGHCRIQMKRTPKQSSLIITPEITRA
jgi:tRNA(Ile)-lysidine synthase